MIERHIRHQLGHAQTIHLVFQAKQQLSKGTWSLLVTKPVLIAPRRLEYRRVFGKDDFRTCTPNSFFVHGSASPIVIIDYGVIKPNWAEKLSDPAARNIVFLMAKPFKVWWVDAYGPQIFDPIAGIL